MRYRSIFQYATIGILAYFIVNAVSAYRKKLQKPDRRSNRTYGSSGTINDQSVLGASVAGQLFSQQYHSKKEENYWLWSQYSAAATALGAILATYFAFGAFTQARRQADAAQEANRPWLSMKKFDITEAQISKDLISASVQIDIENIGNSPAKNVYVIGELGLPFSGESWVEESEYCTNVGDGASTTEQHAFVILPKNTAQKIATVDTPFSKLDGYVRSVPLRVIGCIVYTGNDNVLRHTGFIYRIVTDIDRSTPHHVDEISVVEDAQSTAFLD